MRVGIIYSVSTVNTEQPFIEFYAQFNAEVTHFLAHVNLIKPITFSRH